VWGDGFDTPWPEKTGTGDYEKWAWGGKKGTVCVERCELWTSIRGGGGLGSDGVKVKGRVLILLKDRCELKREEEGENGERFRS